MQTTKTSFRLVLVLLIISIRIVTAQQPAKCLAVITGTSGDVQVKQTHRSEFVKAEWGTQLFQGDQVKTSVRSEASMLFSDGTLITIGENGSITVSGKPSVATGEGTGVKSVSYAAMIDLAALTPKRDTKKDEGILAGLRSTDNEQFIEPASPYNTLIITDRPLFSWIPGKPYESYIVNLYNSKGLVWSRRVKGTYLPYPEDEKELEHGESYFWNVEGEELIDTKKSANIRFSVLPEDKCREVNEQEQIIRNTFRDDPDNCNLHSVLGAYYIKQGLLQNAISEFIIISEISKDAPLPHEILGSLYFEVGHKDKAIEELKKALALTKNGTEN